MRNEKCISLERYIASGIRRVLPRLQSGHILLCGVGLIATSLLVFAQVVNRYWLHFEIMWFGDLALYWFIAFMLFSASVTTWRERHVAVDYFHQRTLVGKPRAIAIHRVLIVAIATCLTGVILYPACKFMLRAVRYPEYATLVPWFNMSWLHALLFFTLGLVFVYLLIIARRDVSNLIKTYRHGKRS